MLDTVHCLIKRIGAQESWLRGQVLACGHMLTTDLLLTRTTDESKHEYYPLS